ncbi:MAG: 16S rRNA (uracil(1498)-N(3))-methyltransferase [Pseudomonadota bacterium]
MRRFIITEDQVQSGLVSLKGPEARHARNVLRLSTGDVVLLVDDRGAEYVSRITSVSRTGVDLTVIEKREAVGEPALNLILGLALLKSDRMEFVIQKGTELGLHALIPLRAARCTVRLEGQRADSRLERWRQIAGQAVKQCRRGRAPEIFPVMDFNEALSQAGTAELKLMLHEDRASASGQELHSLLTTESPLSSIFMLIGPEGGFSRQETALAVESGFHVLGLGPRILRSETAALAAISIVGFILGDLR